MARPTICFVPALASRCRFLPLRCRTTSFPLLICSPIGWPPIANMLLVLIATLFTALLPLALLALLLLSSSFPSSPPRSYATSRRFTYDLVGSNVLACAVSTASKMPDRRERHGAGKQRRYIHGRIITAFSVREARHGGRHGAGKQRRYIHGWILAALIRFLRDTFLAFCVGGQKVGA